MPRIEQLPDGTYAKKIAPFEADIIERLYREVRERRNEAALLQTRVQELEIQYANIYDELESLKMELRQVKQG